MITVMLYNNYSDPTVVNKQISLVDTVDCEITDSCELDAPVLLLDMDESDLPKYNYCYIADFGRYYFCSPQIVNGNQMLIFCESDPLKSFWGDISSSECIAERSTSHPNPELVDDMLPFKPQPKYIVRQLATGFAPSTSGGCYILTVGGK